MNRQAIRGGRWFDLDTATKYDEDTFWNGRNHISRATGSQWDHQALYHTANGKWILHTWSQWEGSCATWEEIDAPAATAWLLANNEEPPDECASEVAALEA